MTTVDDLQTQPIINEPPTDETIPLLQDVPSRSPSNIKKNLIILSVAFLFNFTAYSALQNLQSSLHANTGVASLTVIYAGVTVSCLVAPAVIRILGTKWTMAVGTLCYSIYTLCNFYPKYYTLIPSGLLLGLGGGPLWTAQGTYLTTTAIEYASLKSIVPETVINQFNGIFFFFFQGSQITGNLIGSLVLDPKVSNSSVANLSLCGLSACGGTTGSPNTSSDSDDPNSGDVDHTYMYLIGVYLGCGLVSFLLLSLFLGKTRHNLSSLNSESTVHSLVATFKLMVNPNLALLIPLMVYSGIEQGFIFGDFTQAFITCTNGIRMVGFVMITFGVTDAICSFSLGRLEKYTGRIILFLAGTLAHLTIIVLLLVWKPTSEDLWTRFVIAAVWAFGDAVWQTQIVSFLGVVFHENQETAFSNFRFYQAIGFCIYFGLSLASSVCVFHKLIMIGCLLVISVVLYLIIEFRIRRANVRNLKD